MTTPRGTTSSWEALTTANIAVAALLAALSLASGVALVITAVDSGLQLPLPIVIVFEVVVIGFIILRAVWLAQTRRAADAVYADADGILSHPLMSRWKMARYAIVVPYALLNFYAVYTLHHRGAAVITGAVVVALIPPAYTVVWILATRAVRTRMRALPTTAPRPPQLKPAQLKPAQRDLADLSSLAPRPAAPSGEDL